jgi:hypothetical protein
MAKTLTQVGIETGNAVEAYHVTQSIDAFTGTEAYDITLSGSFNMTGSINVSGSIYSNNIISNTKIGGAINLVSPDGTAWDITVDNLGNLVVQAAI